MVFFTCNACGESLKKVQVEKHVNICRGCEVLSCIDCGKDFSGDDYKSHIRCISEDQKYGGKNYEAKSNKGDVKQQQWLERIHEAMNRPGINSRLKDILHQVSLYDNVPRKKAKFQNWMKSSLKIHNSALHDQVWEIFSPPGNSESGSQHPVESGSQHPVESGSQHPVERKVEQKATESAEQERNNNGASSMERENKQEENGGQVDVSGKGKRKNKQEEKRRKRQANGDVEENGGQEDVSGKGKRKNKQEEKRRKRQANGDVEENGGQEDVSGKGKRKNKQEEKRRKRQANGDAEENGGQVDVSGKGKKRKRGVEDTGVAAENGPVPEEETSIKKRKKCKQADMEEEQPEEAECQSNLKGKFNWKGTIKAILQDSPEEGLPVKKLKKKVLAAYYSFSGDRNYKSEEELFSLFNKKVNSNPKFRVLKEKVKLVK